MYIFLFVVLDGYIFKTFYTIFKCHLLKNFINLLSCGYAGSSLLPWGYCLIAVHGLLIVAASPVGDHGFQSTWASVVAANGLCCPAACGIFPDQGSNPCPLHYQVDS